MNKLILFLALTLSVGPAWQDPEEHPPNPEMDRQEIVNLESEAARAIQFNNGTFFRRVYLDDFAGTLSNGQPVNKNAFIGVVQNAETKYESFSASDINVRVFRDMAIATCLWSARSIYQGQRANSQLRAIHVYINTPRGWKVTAGQATLLPPGGRIPM